MFAMFVTFLRLYLMSESQWHRVAQWSAPFFCSGAHHLPGLGERGGSGGGLRGAAGAGLGGADPWTVFSMDG